MTRMIIALASTFAITAITHLSAFGANEFQALVSRNGRIQLTRGARTLCELGAGLHNAQWASAEAAADPERSATPPTWSLRLSVPGGGRLTGSATISGKQGALAAQYTFTPQEDLALNSLHVAAEFPVSALAGGRWQADRRSGVFPVDFADISLFNGPVRSLQLDLPSGETLTFRFDAPTSVLLQDNRQWGPSFVVRFHRSSTGQNPFPQGEPLDFNFTLTANQPIDVQHDVPVTIVADADWIPLQLELDIEPDSALDFSRLGLLDAPAGKHGWLLARDDGTFRFEQQPDRPARFYGVNLCFSAHYITHEQSDRLAERLARLGYNTVRFHHHEGELTESDPARTRMITEKLDQLDYLFAALTRRGLYVTTDLYVSRPVDIASLIPGFPHARRDAMDTFKVLAALNPAAYENWKTFARDFLMHVNPYTQRAYKDDPGLAWLSLINEGNLGNFLSLAKDIPDYQQAWNRWLAQQYVSREALAGAWGPILKADEDPWRGTVVLDGSVHGQDARGRDVVRFLADVERDFYVRASRFLREELGVRALLTNMNGWTNHVVTQAVRAEMDYVDDHFYVDHPQFIEQPWRLPSRCNNTSPVAGGATGGRTITFTRLFDRPFTLSEYNYSGPGRYRGVGGILTGSMGAIQDWGVIWRFAYSHNRNDLFQPGRMDYFNMSSDPLSQAAERASICLFLRGDMRAAPHRLAITMTPDDLQQPPPVIPSLAPAWHWVAWITRVGTLVEHGPATPSPQHVDLPLNWSRSDRSVPPAADAVPTDPYDLKSGDLVKLLRERNVLRADNPTDPAQNVFQCETGEITIDAPRDVMTLDTERTAGGFAPAGETIQTRHGFTAAVRDVEATVWISALDDQPIVRSKQLLVTHLTDLQNTEIRYAERARQTLLDWGKLPHLVRAGRAEVRVALEDASQYRVWALATSGKRVALVPSRVDQGSLVFTANVSGFAEHGAVLSYEIAQE